MREVIMPDPGEDAETHLFCWPEGKVIQLLKKQFIKNSKRSIAFNPAILLQGVCLRQKIFNMVKERSSLQYNSEKVTRSLRVRDMLSYVH